MKKLAAALFVLSSALISEPAMAQSSSALNYPNKPVRLIVPFSPGGSADVLGRLLAQKLNEKYRQPVVVENRPGAGGNIGAEAVARSTPDGYTLLFGTIGIHSTFDIYPDLKYSPPKDLEPIVILAETPNILIASNKLGLKNTKQIIAASQDQKEKENLFFGSAGFGSGTHIAGELFKYQSKTNITHVPYKGSGPALIDLVGGQLDIMFESFPTALPLIKSGEVTPIAVTGEKRMKSLPDVPTIAEDGLPGYAFTAWFVISAPAGTPESIIEKLNTDIREIMLSQDLDDKFTQMGIIPVPGNRTSKASKAYIDKQTEQFKTLIREAKLTAK